jgi:hypothetical protein
MGGVGPSTHHRAPSTDPVSAACLARSLARAPQVSADRSGPSARPPSSAHRGEIGPIRTRSRSSPDRYRGRIGDRDRAARSLIGDGDRRQN